MLISFKNFLSSADLAR